MSGEDKRGRAIVSSAHLVSERAAELTHQLSTYAGGGKPTFHPVDLCKLVEEMTDLLRVSVGLEA